MNTNKLNNLSHWELHGFAYVSWTTIPIYLSWVYSSTFEVASKIWIFILGLFGPYINESGLVIFIILLTLCLFEPPNELGKIDRPLTDALLGKRKPTLKLLIIGFIAHLIWGDRLIFDMAF